MTALTSLRWALLVGAAPLFSSCVSVPNQQDEPSANPIVGTWELSAAHQVRPGGETLPLAFISRSEGARGVGIYGPDGWMSAQIMGGGVRPSKAQVAGRFSYTPEEAALVVSGYYAYAGPYEVDVARRRVVHKVRYSLHPIEVGRTYERRFNIDGDRLTLETPVFEVDGEPRFNRLVWRRVHGQ